MGGVFLMCVNLTAAVLPQAWRFEHLPWVSNLHRHLASQNLHSAFRAAVTVAVCLDPGEETSQARLVVGFAASAMTFALPRPGRMNSL